ncbi:hypothetical protein [Streptomyces sp. NPDC054887]
MSDIKQPTGSPKPLDDHMSGAEDDTVKPLKPLDDHMSGAGDDVLKPLDDHMSSEPVT